MAVRHFAPRLDALPAQCTSFRTGPLGLEHRCSTCHEWWPADTEFFTRHQHRQGGLASQCKACAVKTNGAARIRQQANAAGSLLAIVPWLGTSIVQRSAT